MTKGEHPKAATRASEHSEKGIGQMAKSESAPTLELLGGQLRACTTVTDLYKLATSDEFKHAALALSDDERSALRIEYKGCQVALDGKVRLDHFDGQVILIVGVDWWYSEQFDNSGVTLHLRPEANPDHKYKALTSSAPIVRFCERFGKELPTEQNPTRAIVSLQPVRDAERAARGQKVWTIKALPAARGVSTGAPF